MRFIKIIFHLNQRAFPKTIYMSRHDLINNNFHKALVTSVTLINLFDGHKSVFWFRRKA